jgi:hypothetical protein
LAAVSLAAAGVVIGSCMGETFLEKMIDQQKRWGAEQLTKNRA